MTRASKRVVRFVLVLLVCFGGSAAQPPGARRHVIVISLDGFPAYSLEDPKLPIPTLRKLAARGAVARRMTTVNPTVTWPNHTALVTGVDASRHGLLVNGALTRTGAWPPVRVEPWIPQPQMVHAPTLYDLANQKGLTTAQVDWVAIKSAPAITWEFPEVPSRSGAIEREMIRRKLIDPESIEQFGKINIFRRDEIWTDAAVHILREHKPNLLLFHVLSLDSTHHTYGPGSLAALGAMAFLDSCVSRLLDAIRAAGLEDTSSVIIVSDHGFKQVQKQIHLSAALAETHLGDRVFALPEGGMALVYVDRKNALETIAAVRKRFAGIEGVAEIAGPDRFEALGLPAPERDPQMSDLVVLAKPGYAFGSRKSGEVVTTNTSPTGAHGYVSTDPEIDAIFIASGNGIREGVVVECVRNVDVAPTIAALLGFEMPDGVRGAVVRNILRQRVP